MHLVTFSLAHLNLMAKNVTVISMMSPLYDDGNDGDDGDDEGGVEEKIVATQ